MKTKTKSKYSKAQSKMVAIQFETVEQFLARGGKIQYGKKVGNAEIIRMPIAVRDSLGLSYAA